MNTRVTAPSSTPSATYYKASMEMLTPALRKEVFESGTTILTRVKNSPPTLYGFESKVKNSLIADGCTIDGDRRELRHLPWRQDREGRGAERLRHHAEFDHPLGRETGMRHHRQGRYRRSGACHGCGYPTYPFVISKGQTV